MAIAAAAVWEVRSTANANNAGGGFFVTGASGVDYSQQNAPQYSLTAGSAGGAGAVISHASAAADMVGNGLRIVSGTNATVGWYEILSVVAGVSITVDRNCTTGASANIVFNVGGALGLNQDATNQTAWTTMVGGNKMFIKNGTYTLGSTMNCGSTNGTSTAHIVIEGYNSTRGDLPMGSTRPTITGGAFIGGNLWSFRSIIWSNSSAGTLFNPGSRCTMTWCKFVNTTTTANQAALATSNYSVVSHCEAMSLRGRAISHSNSVVIANCYIHDSDIGILNGNAANGYPHSYINNIIENCVTYGIRMSSSNDTPVFIYGNTIYGAENKLGIGISVATTATSVRMQGNNFVGLTTGIDITDASGSAQGSTFFDNWNNFYNCTTDVSNITKGASSIALNPSFANVTQLTGTGGVVSGSTLTVSSATGLVANQDVIYIISGTGATAGLYLITGIAGNVLTLHTAPGGSDTNIVYQATKGHNFAPGANLKGTGPLGAFPGSLTTGYQDIGAVQRLEDYPTESTVVNGTVYGNGSLTGTYNVTKSTTFIG